MTLARHGPCEAGGVEKQVVGPPRVKGYEAHDQEDTVGLRSERERGGLDSEIGHTYGPA